MLNSVLYDVVMESDAEAYLGYHIYLHKKDETKTDPLPSWSTDESSDAKLLEIKPLIHKRIVDAHKKDILVGIEMVYGASGTILIILTTEDHNNERHKPMKAKPAYYAVIYEKLKGIAELYGYNLLIHGSVNRDLDLVAIPWADELLDVDDMIKHMAKELGGHVMGQTEEQQKCFPHGRESRIINIFRGEGYKDEEYYLDISVIPPFKTGR